MEMRRTTFDGLDAVEITTREARLVAITTLGPRIAFFGRPGGANLLYWKNDDLGREGWRLLGGHRPWVTRIGADESEDAYAADNEPCMVEERVGGVRITGGAHPFLKTARGIDIQVIDERTFRVTTFLTNCGPMLYACGLWAPTCTDPAGGKQYAIPLGDRRQTWDVITIVIPRTFAGHGSRVNDPQIACNEDHLIVTPQGIETKRMLRAPLGIVAMTWPAERLSFVKRAPFNPLAPYPLTCNLALYVGPDNYMVEMETYGPEQPVQPGQTVEHAETWMLLDRVFDWQDPADLAGLA